ncbi:MAG TPA: hypothetical protein VFP54_09520 [Acidimicrobiales bacterium]|nr:hypothetical protein [Acidimicrobiales bacterium]
MTGSGNEEGVPALASELWTLVLTYAKQETVQPLKGLVKFVAVGVGGALLFAIGVAVLLLAGLRAMQTETTWFSGTTNWAPYLIAAGGGVVVAAVAAGAIFTGRARRTG